MKFVETISIVLPEKNNLSQSSNSWFHNTASQNAQITLFSFIVCLHNRYLPILYHFPCSCSLICSQSWNNYPVSFVWPNDSINVLIKSKSGILLCVIGFYCMLNLYTKNQSMVYRHTNQNTMWLLYSSVYYYFRVHVNW